MSDFLANRGMDCLSHHNKETTQFINFVKRTAEKLGYDPNAIAAKAKGLSCVDLSDYNMSTEIMPNDILQELRTRYCHNQQHSNCNDTDNAIVYIHGNLTARLIRSEQIAEQLTTPQRLYQYLFWTMKMNKIARTMIEMKTKDGHNVLIIDVELHDQRGQNLYALCIPNNERRPSQGRDVQVHPWKLSGLFIASDVVEKTACSQLPRGVRAVSSQFGSYRRMKNNVNESNGIRGMKQQILSMDEQEHKAQCGNLKSFAVQSKTSDSTKKVLSVGVSELYEAVHSALRNDNIDLIPILSRVLKKAACGKREENFRSVFMIQCSLNTVLHTKWVFLRIRCTFLRFVVCKN